MESSGSEAKLRGSAQQVHEKYLSLARDALSSGDRIGAENYFQFADHYFRVINAANGSANSGGNGRGDRNNKIPPPPETAASQIVIDESGARISAPRVAEKAAGESTPVQAPDLTISSVAATEAPTQEAAPVAKDLFSAETKVAEPASQAAELAVALARAKTDETAGDSPGAPEKPQDAVQGAAADSPGEEAPKRRRRSALGVGVKRTTRGRPRKAAEGDAADQPVAPEVKPVRRRTRKAAAPKKTEEITPETA